MEKKKKVCPEGSFLNELTNRCNKIKKTKTKKTEEGMILNPKTGRYVSITGKLGKEILKNQVTTKPSLDSFDKIKQNLSKMGKIKLTPDNVKLSSSFVRFNEIGMVKKHSFNYFDEQEGETIHGQYKKTKFIMQNVLQKDYVFPADYSEADKSRINRDGVICLLLHENDKYIRIPDLKEAIESELCPCNIFIKKGIEDVSDIMAIAKDFLEYVFEKSPRDFDVRIHKFVYPSNYIDSKDVQQYKDYPTPVPTVAVSTAGSNLDVVYVSLLNDEIVYVFHVNRSPGNSMKGYQAVGISVVARYKYKRYSYHILARINCQGWGVSDIENEDNLAVYMKEIRNIILSKGFLAKFRCIPQYPKFVLGCNVSKNRVKIRSCY
jgi:hypothetical protein